MLLLPPRIQRANENRRQLMLVQHAFCFLLACVLGGEAVSWMKERRRFVAYSVSPVPRPQPPLPYKTMHRSQKRRPNHVDVTTAVVAGRVT